MFTNEDKEARDFSREFLVEFFHNYYGLTCFLNEKQIPKKNIVKIGFEKDRLCLIYVDYDI